MINKFVIMLIQALRPLLGPSGVCRYYYSCYDYGIEQFQNKSFFTAFYLATKRVLSCNPFCAYSRHSVSIDILDIKDDK